MFDHIVGNEPIKAYFIKALKTNTLPSALLISGSAGLGKSLFAKGLAEALLQTKNIEIHPDFHSLRPESKSGLHSIDSLRLLIDEVHASAYQSSGKVWIIYDVERMQTTAANALLKTLEEPNPDTTLILVTEEPNAILPTIRSRCSFLALKPIAEQLIATFLKSKGFDEKWAKLSQGSIGKAIELATKPPFEELLFALLTTRPSYPKLLMGIEKIEVAIDDEDPLKKNQNVEQLLTAFLTWHRDQHARKIGLEPKDLFFPDAPSVDFPLPPLEKVIALVDQARASFKLNIKFATCLESLFTN